VEAYEKALERLKPEEREAIIARVAATQPSGLAVFGGDGRGLLAMFQGGLL